MVPVRSKIVAFKEDQYLNELGQEIIASSTASMMYELDGYSEERRNITSEITLIETFDDSLSSDASVVQDAKENPTQLYLQLHYGLWDISLNTIKNNSLDTMTWLMRDGIKVLPIHVACESTCPVGIIEAFIDYSPKCLQCATSKGSLPLHLLCANEHFLRYESVVLKVMEVFPESLLRADHSNRTPIEILNSFPETEKIKYDRLMESFESKMQTLSGRKFLKQVGGGENEMVGELLTPKQRNISKENFSCDTDFLLSPSMDERESLAINLNKKRMEPIAYRSSPEDAEFYHNLSSAETILDSDDNVSTNSLQRRVSYSRTQQSNANEMEYNEQKVFQQAIDISDDEVISTSQVQNSPIKILKLIKENTILREKVMGLSKENTSLESDRDEKSSIIEDLRLCIEKERELSKKNTREYDLAMTRLTDQMNEVKHSAHSKLKSEKVTAKRISELEVSIASKNAELSTVKSALHEEATSKASIAKDLFIQRNENEVLSTSVSSKEHEIQTTRRQLEVVTKDFETCRKINEENQSRINHMVKEMKLKVLQNRALTDSLSAIDNKNQALEKMNDSLRSETSDIKNMLRLNAETYAANVADLEENIERSRKSETNAIREREKTSEDLSKKVQEISSENNDLRKQIQTKKEEIVLLSKEIESLHSDSAAKSSKIERTEHRLETLYVELTNKQRREQDMEQKNEDCERKIQELSQEQSQKAEKLQVLQEAVESYKAEIESLATEKTENDETIQRTLEKLAQTEEKLESECCRVAELESKLSAAEVREAKVTEKANSMEVKTNELLSQAESLKRQLELTRQKTEEQETMTSQRKEDLEKLTADYKELKGTNVMVQNDYSQLKSEFGELRQEYKVLQGTSKHQQALFEILQQENIDLKGINTKIKDDYEQLTKASETLESHFNELQKSRDKIQEEYKQLKKNFEGMEPKYHTLHESNNDLNEQLKELQTLYQKKEKDEKSLAQKLELSQNTSEQQTLLLNNIKSKLNAMVQNHVEVMGTKKLQSHSAWNEQGESGTVTNFQGQDLEHLLTVLKARLSDLETTESLSSELQQSYTVSQETVSRLKEELKLSVDTVRALTRAERAQMLSNDQVANFVEEKDRLYKNFQEQKECWYRKEQELEAEIKQLESKLNSSTQLVEMKKMEIKTYEDNAKVQIAKLSEHQEVFGEELNRQKLQWQAEEEKLKNEIDILKEQLGLSSKKSESSEVCQTSQPLHATATETIEMLKKELTSIQEQLDERSEALRIAAEENNELNKEIKQLRIIQSKQKKSLREVPTLKKELQATQMERKSSLEVNVVNDQSSETITSLKKESDLQREQCDEQANSVEQVGEQSYDVTEGIEKYAKAQEANNADIKNADISISLGEELALAQEELKGKGEENEKMKKRILYLEAEHKKNVNKLESSTLTKLQISEEALRQKTDEFEAIKAKELSKEVVLVKLKEELAVAQEELKERRKECHKMEEIIASMESEHKKAVDSFESTTASKLQISEDALRQKTEELEAMKAEAVSKEEALVTLKASVAALQKSLEEKSLIEAEHKKEAELRESAALSKLEGSEEALKKQTEEITTLKSEISKREENIATMKASVDSLTQALNEKCEDCQRFEDINKSYQVEVGRLLKKNDALRDEKEKDKLQRDYHKVAEENTANSANIEYLLGNLKVSENRLMDLTLKHKSLLDESSHLREVIAEKEALNAELQELNNKLVSMDETASENLETASVSSTEWDKHIATMLSKYSQGKVSFDYEAMSAKVSNRAKLREALRKKVTEAFDSQSSKISQLNGLVESSESQASNYENKIQELESTNETLKLENKILKTTGKDIDKRFHKMQHKLKEENKRLKQAIAKLSQETADYQKKIRELVVKQGELQRKKEVVLYSGNEETIGLTPQAKPSTEDGGSLAFSLSSQDVEDYTPACNDTMDQNIEIVLQESRDEREKTE